MIKETSKQDTASMDLDEAVRLLQLTPLERPVVGGEDNGAATETAG